MTRVMPQEGAAVPSAEIVFMFSGQGSQHFQMGRALFERNDCFRESMTRLDGIARQAAGESIIATLYSDVHGKGEPFDRTLLTHPAIFMVEYSLAQCLMRSGVQPAMVLGVSLGSFAAAAVAGFIDVDAALIAVIRQARALEACGEPGGMIAVLADPALYGRAGLNTRSELAAVNFSSHFVVSARQTELAEIEADLEEHRVGHQRLPVSFPFHSQWIDGAKADFESHMRSVRCRQGRVPLVCSEETTAVSDVSDGYFWNVVRRPIRFHDTVARLERRGAHRYIDVGPAGTLATFLKYGLLSTTRSTVHAILTPYGFDERNLATTLASMLASMTPVRQMTSPAAEA